MDNLLDLTLGIMRPEPKKRSGRKPVRRKKASSKASVPKDLSFMMGKHVPPDLKDKILERDENTCRYCGFHSEKYQNVHHRDLNLGNLKEDNLVTACVFCHQCFYLEQVSQMESGMLIWLPELSQAQLNNIARAVYVGRISQGPIAEASRKVYDVLLARREAAVERVSTDNPFILSTVLKDYLAPKAYALRGKKLDGLRLFPLDKRMVQEGELKFNQFPQILAYWRSKNGPFGGKAPTDWVAITEDILFRSQAA